MVATRTVFKLSLSGAAMAAALASAPAMAQDGQQTAQTQTGLGTIVVTAQRREENVQEIPIAISAFNQAELENRGVSDALDLAQYVPNLVGLNNTGLGSANSYFLRGIGNTETIATFDPPIGTYVDDVYISRQNANNLSLFDVERVEVLRGPQGTLFGRNTTGGAISIVLAEPGDEYAGYAEIGYGSYDSWLGRASVDIPIADTFALKVSGFVERDDGYVRNVTTGQRNNDSNAWGARLGWRGELSDNVRWTGSFMHIESDGENQLNFDCNPANPTDCDGRFSTTGLIEGARLTNGPLVGLLTGEKQFFGMANRTENNMITSNLEIGDRDLRVNVITGYIDLRQRFALDFADGRGLPSISSPVPPVQGFAAGGFTIANDGSHEQFTQEIKLTGNLGDGLVDFVAGLYYFREWNTTDFGDIFTLGIAPGGFPLLLADRVLENNAEAWAGYVQADFNVTDALTLTAGVRYTDEEKDVTFIDNRGSLGNGLCIGPNQFGPSPCLINSNLIASNGAQIPTEQSVDVWTPRFAISYQVNPDFMVFASATRGFKSGGWNARGTSPGTLLPFDPEFAWSYEAGFRSEWFDRRLRLNVTGYILDVSGLQTPSALINPNTGAIDFITRNFADYENMGLEVEINAQPLPGFNVFAAIGYQDDEYQIPSNAPDFDAFGVQSVGAQQAACRAQLAAGLTAGGRDPDGPGPAPSDQATACANGIVTADGSIAEPVRTPDWTLAFGASYEAVLGNSGMTLTPSVNATYQSDQEVGTSNVNIFDAGFTSPGGVAYQGNLAGNGNFVTGSFSEAHWIVNSSLTLRGEDDNWALTLECNNCFDEEYIQSALANYSYLNRPRTWMVRGRITF